MTNSKKNLVRFIFFTLGILFIGSICTSLLANEHTVMRNFIEYESFILAVLFLFLSISLCLKGKYTYILVLFMYIIFYVFQLLIISDVLIDTKFWLYLSVAIYLLVSILLLAYLRNVNFHQDYFICNLSKLLISIFLLFIFEISSTIFIFLRPDIIKKIYSTSNEIIYLIPWNLIISLVGLCGALLIIKFSMKLKIRDFLKDIGILSKKDLKVGFVVFISIIIFLQAAEIFVSLFLDYPYSIKNNRFAPWKEWLSSIIDMFGVGLHEEIVCRGFLFYIVCCAVGKSKKSTINLMIVIVLSQAFFSLIHLPRMLILFEAPIREIIPDLIYYFAMGVFFVICYIRTKSIYATIFIHTLFNFGDPIYSGDSLRFLASQSSLVILFVITLLIFWDYFPKYIDRKILNKDSVKEF